jgi:hypothetical protein
MGARPLHGPLLSAADAIAQAERAFEARLASLGEGVCIASLPLLADEVAAEAAGGDERLAALIRSRLRCRAGLNEGY